MNYKHLHYFWTVLRTGSIARASEQLHLTPQTLSGQIKQLEERLGKPLLRKAGLSAGADLLSNSATSASSRCSSRGLPPSYQT